MRQLWRNFSRRTRCLLQVRRPRSNVYGNVAQYRQTLFIFHRLPILPGIEVPYISAIVDLDDGTAIKGNLINVEPDPENIAFDMPVEVVYDDALGRKDADGNAYLSYFFQPAASA